MPETQQAGEPGQGRQPCHDHHADQQGSDHDLGFQPMEMKQRDDQVGGDQQ